MLKNSLTFELYTTTVGVSMFVMSSSGAMLRNETFALALEPSILVNNTGMSWQRVRLLPKAYVIVVDNQAIASCPCQVKLVMAPPSPTGDDAVESY
jgi:hypothetical protein